MIAQLLDGRIVANAVYHDLKNEIEQLREDGCEPFLTVVIVGDDPASKTYVRNKHRACEKNGIRSETIELPAETTEADLLGLISELNGNDDVHGILVQLPLPGHIREDRIIEAIVPEKDVDGFHPVNRGKLAAGADCFEPCTPAGIRHIFKHYHIEPKGKHLVVIGRSQIVGIPFALMMMQKKEWANATVTVCHTATADVSQHTKMADIVVLAAGHPHTLTGDMIKPGCVVIDVGTNRVEDAQAEKGYRWVGDADFDSVKEIAGMITPVPGGVGPMTIAMLLKNTVRAAKLLHQK